MNVRFALQEIPEDQWPATKLSRVLFRVAIVGGCYLAQCYEEPGDIVRLTVCSTNATSFMGHLRFVDGIPWDHLQEIKRVLGYGEREAFEVYPPDDQVVDRANMRHLWILPDEIALPFSWRRPSQGDGDAE